jgi:hypothetical protein
MMRAWIVHKGRPKLARHNHGFLNWRQYRAADVFVNHELPPILKCKIGATDICPSRLNPV